MTADRPTTEPRTEASRNALAQFEAEHEPSDFIDGMRAIFLAIEAEAAQGAAPRAEPWDHPYDGDSDWPDRCIHCGFVGSYAHTEEFYRKWVHPGAAPRAEGLNPDDAERVVSNLLSWGDRYRNADPTLHPEEWYIVRDDARDFLARLSPSDERVPESEEPR